MKCSDISGCKGSKMKTEREDGVPCVYFIQQGADGPIKIGTTEGDPVKRMAALQTGNPITLRLLAYVYGGRDVEGQIHEDLKHYRMSGEWFESKPEVVGYVRGIQRAHASGSAGLTWTLENMTQKSLDEANHIISLYEMMDELLVETIEERTVRFMKSRGIEGAEFKLHWTVERYLEKKSNLSDDEWNARPKPGAPEFLDFVLN